MIKCVYLKASKEESEELKWIWLIDTQINNVLNNVAISFNVGLCLPKSFHNKVSNKQNWLMDTVGWPTFKVETPIHDNIRNR
jgi:hypothetical protein